MLATLTLLLFLLALIALPYCVLVDIRLVKQHEKRVGAPLASPTASFPGLAVFYFDMDSLAQTLTKKWAWNAQ